MDLGIIANKKIEDVEYLRCRTLLYLLGDYQNLLFKDVDPTFSVRYTGSGRAALRIILDYYKKSCILPDKNTPVLVPRWMCYSVLSSMQKFCNPVLKSSNDLQGILVFHQYGFPQDMDTIGDFCSDHDLFLIEDCAHAYESSYRGRRLGTLSDASIFSFSKQFPSLLGGALMTSNKELGTFAREIALTQGEWLIRHSTYRRKFFYECLKGRLGSFFDRWVQNSQEMSFGILDRSYTISPISLRAINAQLKTGVWEQRKKNYRILLDSFNDQPEFFFTLEREGVIPCYVPLFDSEPNLKKTANVLSCHNIMREMGGILHFDVNRNLLEPDYRKCILIPVHQGIDDVSMERICEIIRYSQK